jgi:hypothetical protein
MTGSAIRRGAVLALLALALWAQPAAAQEWDCLDEAAVDRCDPAQQGRVRAMYGVATIEAHRDAGDQVRRVFYVDGSGNDVLAIVFIRAPGRDPELRVHFRREQGEPGPAAMVALVPAGQWSALIERSAHFDRAMVPRPVPTDEETICTHGWVYTVEASDPAPSASPSGSVRRRTESACHDGLAAAYAVEIYRAALALLPYCGQLDSRQHRNPAMQIEACRALRGDRLAAAMVMNRVEPLGWIDRSVELARIAPLFHHSASVDWDGERNSADQLDGAARLYLARSIEGNRPRLRIDSVDGERSDRVRLRGALVRNVAQGEGEEERQERAPVELVWEAPDGGEFTIRSARIGRYEPMPAASATPRARRRD